MRKILCAVLALLLVLALLPASAVLGKTAVSEPPVNPNAVGTKDEDETEPDPERIVTFMVKLKGSPVASKVRSLDSDEALKLRSLLKKEQERVMREAEALFSGEKAEFPFSYQLLFNGFAVNAPYSMRGKLESLPGVESVFVAPVYAAPEDTAEPGERLSTSVGLINAEEAWDMGYTGSGTAIAIIDTGCSLGHEAFSTDPANGKIDSAYITSALQNSELHAEELYSGTLSASGVYYSGKIPFRFNYSDGTANVSHSYSHNDHGTHSAGVAAGNGPSEYKGVAKDAQLVIMQVYEPESTSDWVTANWATVMAALEDCAYLGVDAIDLSFGRDLGYSSGSEETEAVFALLASRGINVSASAGDSGSSNGQQYYGSAFKYALAMNPDNGLISAPASYSGPLAVASCTKQSPSVSNISNAGCTSDLKLKPEITAPGVNVTAPVDPGFTDGGSGYDTKTGTGTAAAHVSGAQALMTEYVNDTFPTLTAKEKAEMVDRLLMCTAVPIAGVSPRRQGSGVMNIGNAVSTGAYITVDGCARPKLELGDDPDSTGSYTLTFDVVNFGGHTLSFVPEVTVLTPATDTKKLHNETVDIIGAASKDITANCTISAPSSVVVTAGNSKSVTITVTLSDTQKNSIDSVCPNGAFIEGFVVLNGSVSLTLPFMAFYGDWNRASVIDRYTYIDQITGGQQLNVHSRQLQVGAYYSSSDFMLFGANPYVDCADWLADRCTLSPNGDEYYDQIDRISAALLRNTSSASIRIEKEGDPDTVYYYEELTDVPKSWRYRASLSSYPWSYVYQLFGFEDFIPFELEEGDHIVFTMSFELDSPGFTHQGNECSQIVLPMTVDVTPPEITHWNLHNGVIDLTVHDEHYAAWAAVYADPDCTSLIGQQAIAEQERGASTELSFSIGSYTTVYVMTGDYGRNTSEVFALSGEGPHSIISASIAPDSLQIVPGQRAALRLELDPSNTSVRSVVWQSSDTGVLTVEGNGLSAEAVGVSLGTAAVTAVVTDTSGNSVTASAAIAVRNGYEYDRFEPTDEILYDTEYLIGFSTGDAAYLLMNYNPDPLSTNKYYYSYDGVKYAYGIRGRIDAEGNVTGIYDYAYPDASMINVMWTFDAISDLLQITSCQNTSYFLKADIGASSMGLFPSYGTGSSIAWSWNAPNLTYASLTALKTVTYVPSVGSDSDFFCAPPEAGEGSDIVLYKHVTGVKFIDDPASFRVRFLDWNGNVLSEQTVTEGLSAEAPASPQRFGYLFAGWDRDVSHVSCDIDVNAVYVPLAASLLGDVNCSGAVEMADVSQLAAYFLNMGTVTDQGLVNSDANCDGRLDVLDISAVCNIMMGH